MSNVFVFRRPPHGVITEYFGGGKGGSSTTTNNVTQIPPEVLARYNAVNARAEAVAQQPYQAYSDDPNAFVAPLNATQQAGIQNTNIMAGAAQPYYGAATDQLIQAQAGAQPGINAAYQNVGQAQNVGNQYANAAAQQYGAAQGVAAPYYQAATQGTQQALQGAQPYQGLATAAALSGAQGVGPGALQTQRYMNPFTQNVVQATQAALNQQQGQQLAQQQADAIKGGAFGSGRAALQRAQLQGQQSLAQSQAISPLLQQNYQQALAAAQQQQGVGLGAAQANRAAIQQAGQQLGALGQQTYGQQLGAAQQMGNLGQNLYGQALGTGQAQAALGQQQYGQGQATAQQLAALAQQGYGMGAGTSAALAGLGTNAQQAGLAGAQAQLAAGQTQQQTQQAGLQAMYNQFLQQQGFPYQQAQFLANIATGTGALSGNATSGTSTTTGGGGFFSDERLKENIQRVGETDDGQPIYRYNYKGDKNTQIGLLAQDVEKHHPEAVGLAGGYKTVNYKKATEDAVHKADGGAAGDAYSMGAPSQMLQENSGKGLGAVPRLPQMITGPQRIEAGADAANLAALRAPKATGYSLGTREGKEAELASLQSSLAQPPGPNGDLLGSGPQYLQSRIGTLQDWLNKNNSQGGLVGPQGGNFARGGLAEGGYMNPALAYYGPQQSQGDVYGVKLQPLGQHGILQGQQMQAPQQKQQPDAVASAMNMAKLVQTGNEAYKARPDFLRSAEDIVNRKNEQLYRDSVREEYFKKHGIEPEKVAEISPEDSLVVPEVYAARGGLIGDRHHYSRGGINPYGGLGGGNDILGPIIEQQDTSLRLPGDKATPPPQAKQQQSGGLGDIMKAKSIYDMGDKAYKGGQWAAGKLGLGEASPTAMSATSTEALPGVAGGVVPEAVAPVVPEAVTAAVPEVAAAAVPEALTAGLAGAETVAAPVAMAAAEGVADLAPLLFFLKNGGAVPRRRHFDGTDGSFVAPEDVGGGDTTATGGDDQTTTIRRTDPLARPAPIVREPVETPRAREPGVAPASRSSMPDLGGLIPEGAKDTLSSENFWVPAIAGLGAMLASPNKTLAGAIGSGLVGGTGAYTEMQKQTGDQLMKRLQFNKDRFKGPVLVDGQERYQDTVHGDWVDEPTMQGRLATFIGERKLAPIAAPAPLSPAASAVTTAKEEIGAPKPKIETTGKPPVPPAATQEAGALAPTPVPTPAAAAEVPKPPATTQAATATAQPAGEKPVDDIMAPPPSKLQLMNQARQNAALFADVPENRRPDYLEREGKRLQAEANDYQRQADQFAADAKKLAKNPSAQTQYLSEATRLSSLATARRTEADQKNKSANEMLEGAIGPALANSDAIAKAQAELKFAGPKAAQALKDKVAELKATQPLALEGKEAEYSFTEGYKRQQLALTDAAKEAKEAQSLINQSNAILRASFDEKGKPTYSGGPLGSRLTNLSALMVQAGFSPSFVKDFTGTDPRNAQAARKLQTDAASEMARIALNGSPVRVTEFNQYLATTPGEDLLPEAMKWIVNNVIKPKAESLVGAYEKVKKLDPGKNNIEAELFDYRRDNPWFNPVKISENEAAQTAAPAGAIPPGQEEVVRQEMQRRRSAQGAR